MSMTTQKEVETITKPFMSEFQDIWYRHGGGKVGNVEIDGSATQYEIFWLDDTMTVFYDEDKHATENKVKVFNYTNLEELENDAQLKLRRCPTVKRQFQKIKNSKRYLRRLLKQPFRCTFSDSIEGHSSATA